MAKELKCSDGRTIFVQQRDRYQVKLQALDVMLDNQDKHELIMALIETMPDYMKRHYTPEAPRPRSGW